MFSELHLFPFGNVVSVEIIEDFRNWNLSWIVEFRSNIARFDVVRTFLHSTNPIRLGYRKSIVTNSRLDLRKNPRMGYSTYHREDS